jgi:hypothetical protein
MGDITLFIKLSTSVHPRPFETPQSPLSGPSAETDPTVSLFIQLFVSRCCYCKSKSRLSLKKPFPNSRAIPNTIPSMHDVFLPLRLGARHLPQSAAATQSPSIASRSNTLVSWAYHFFGAFTRPPCVKPSTTALTQFTRCSMVNIHFFTSFSDPTFKI